MKYLLGVLHGKWIVRTSWVAECLQSQQFASEEPHEVVTDTGGRDSGPILGRLHAGLKLLKNWEVAAACMLRLQAVFVIILELLRQCISCP